VGSPAVRAQLSKLKLNRIRLDTTIEKKQPEVHEEGLH